MKFPRVVVRFPENVASNRGLVRESPEVEKINYVTSVELGSESRFYLRNLLKNTNYQVEKRVLYIICAVPRVL